MKPAILAAALLLATTAAPSAQGCSAFTVTSYAASQFPGVVRDGITTTWQALARGEGIVAVDPRVIPLGSVVWVEGLGVATARDTGGGVRGAHVDWLSPTVAEALEIGRSTRTVCVLPDGEES